MFDKLHDTLNLLDKLHVNMLTLYLSIFKGFKERFMIKYAAEYLRKHFRRQQSRLWIGVLEQGKI